MSNLSRSFILISLILLNIVTISLSIYINLLFYILVFISFIPLCIAIYDVLQKEHSLLRNFPLLGRLRWVFESERSKIQQYFVESDINGKPYSREQRSDIYQKSKGDKNTIPFGTQHDVYEPGYEYINHSIYAKSPEQVKTPTVRFGNKFTTKPYTTSILNVSGMSFGSLSGAAVTALNGGAKLGGFFQNTGEGSISSHHLKKGGDLVFQVASGYNGCGSNDKNGVRMFDSSMFRVNSRLPQVKMIELKLSQGAKPGHGGILPANKNTDEIANVRGVEAHVRMISPPAHTQFTDNEGMLKFITELRELSGGKPVGIKMCVGNKEEVENLIKNMYVLDMYPDFITVDGAEGGTGASPIVYTNSVGSPLVEGLLFIVNILKKYDLRDKIKVIASGKISTSFDVIKMIALGADSVNAARAFLLSLGCIQARECDKDTCPVGITTQNKKLVKGLDVATKEVRVYNYHKAVIHEVREVLGSMGLTNIDQLDLTMINKRVSSTEVKTFYQLYN